MYTLDCVHVGLFICVIFMCVEINGYINALTCLSLSVVLPVCMPVPHVCTVPSEANRASDPLGPKLQMTVSLHVDSETEPLEEKAVS